MPKDIINTTPNTNRARRNNDRIPEFEDDYVLEGCGLSIDADNELTVTHGELTITHGGQVYHVAVAGRTGSDTIPVPDNSSLGVYYDISPNDIVLQASAPASPSLQIGTVDSSAGATTEVNREPARRARSLNTASLTDAADGDDWETLRDVGYQQGDVLPLTTLVNGGSNGTQTTSTTYITAFSTLQNPISWAVLPNTTDAVQIRLTVQTEGLQSDMSVRVIDAANGDAVVAGPVTIPSAQGFAAVEQGEWQEYAPQTDASIIRAQIKSEGGSQVGIRNILLYVGVEI